MQLPSDRFALKARYVFPVAGPPLADAVITIDQGRIESVSRQSPRCDTIDLGNVAILPGLVNAHTHLEFSDLAAPLWDGVLDGEDDQGRAFVFDRSGSTWTRVARLTADGGLNEVDAAGMLWIADQYPPAVAACPA